MGVCQSNPYKVPKPDSTECKIHNEIEKHRHSGSILGLSSTDEQIFSCSDDKSIAVSPWGHASRSKSIKEPENLTILRGHSRAVNCVSSFKDISGRSKCWTVSRDLSVKLVRDQLTSDISRFDREF